MAKEKRTYQVEVIRLTDLRLEPAAPKQEEHQNPESFDEPRKQIFSPELISRLTERIKKL
jgi:hypothetical protein